MDRKKLMNELVKVYPAVDARAVTEEMKCFRFAGRRVVASNGNVAVWAELPEDTGIDGLVPAEKFFHLLSDLREDELEIEQKDNELHITCGRCRARYKIRPHEGGFLDSLKVEVPDDAWRPWPEKMDEGLKLCRFAASRDASQGALCGVHVDDEGLVATDSYRIVGYSGARLPEGWEPLTLSQDLLDVLAKQGEAVESWAVVDGTVYLSLGSTKIGARLLASEFPAGARQFLAQAAELPEEVELPQELIEAVRRHGDQMSDVPDLDREITVLLGEGKLTISSSDGVLYELSEDLDLPDSATKVSFKVNPSFLADVLGLTRKMAYGADKRMVAFKAEDFTYLTAVEWV